LTNHYRDWIGLDEIEKILPMSSDGKQGDWLVKRRDKSGSEVKVCHGVGVHIVG